MTTSESLVLYVFFACYHFFFVTYSGQMNPRFGQCCPTRQAFINGSVAPPPLLQHHLLRHHRHPLELLPLLVPFLHNLFLLLLDPGVNFPVTVPDCSINPFQLIRPFEARSKPFPCPMRTAEDGFGGVPSPKLMRAWKCPRSLPVVCELES